MFFFLMNGIIVNIYAENDPRLIALRTKEGSEFRHAVSLYYDSVRYILDSKRRTELAEELYSITKEKDKIAHIGSLMFRALSTENQSTKLFDEAYQIIEKYDLDGERLGYEYNVSYYYVNRHQVDSAMIHFLRYRDLFKSASNKIEYLNISHLFADMYYHAGLYQQAKELYNELYCSFESDSNWEYYIPYVVMNNLGQLALIEGDYSTAHHWFSHSLSLSKKHLHTSYRDNILAYTMIRLAETELVMQHIKVSDSLLTQVAAFPDGSYYEDVKQEYLFIKARLYASKLQFKEALTTSLKLIPVDSVRFSNYRFIPEIYKLLSDIYHELDNDSLALQYSKQYIRTTQSMMEREHAARSMMILAEREHALAQEKLHLSQNRIINLSIGLSILSIILIIIIVLYSKLYQSKLALVRKTVLHDQMALSLEKSAVTNIEPSNNWHMAQDSLMQKELINLLMHHLNTEQPYLNPQLTIHDLAKSLNTNRTYLSRAINNELHSTFPNFINDFRIKESIRLIKSGFILTHTQEALGKQCGFANRNGFIRAFKRHTGVTPSFFISKFQKYS